MLIRLIGMIPGPVVIGNIFDYSCLVQAKSCGSSRIACVAYNNKSLSERLFSIPLIFKVTVYSKNTLSSSNKKMFVCKLRSDFNNNM